MFVGYHYKHLEYKISPYILERLLPLAFPLRFGLHPPRANGESSHCIANPDNMGYLQSGETREPSDERIWKVQPGGGCCYDQTDTPTVVPGRFSVLLLWWQRQTRYSLLLFIHAVVASQKTNLSLDRDHGAEPGRDFRAIWGIHKGDR